MQNHELKEKDFIHEEYPKHPWRIWSWFAVIVGCSLLFSWGLNRYTSVIDKSYAASPFLQVTNREMSLFLWQNTNHMRVHAKNKSNYLPAFDYIDHVGLNPEYAEDFVIAPPELLFLYHTWNRLLGNVVSSRSILAAEFKQFLLAVPEWQPNNWPQAPQSYAELVNDLKTDKNDVSHSLPVQVRQAYIGWKNYFFEGNAINDFSISNNLLQDFLKIYPHYARNYWRNIYGANYLKDQEDDANAIIPDQHLSSALRLALYNFKEN